MRCTLEESNIKTILKEYYGVDRVNISPQRGGWSALAFKVFDDRHTYFLKMYEKSRASTSKWTALIDEYVPILLWLTHNSGLKGKIPVPILTKNGDYKCEDEDGIYLLYEYIDGKTIGEKNLTLEQVCQLSEIISELHLYGAEIPVKTDAIMEDFHVPFLQSLRNILDKGYDMIPVDVREVIHPFIEQMKGLIDSVDKLSSELKNSNLRMTLCHTDIHNWNLMQSDQRLILIDWEGLRLAPVEADMMFLVDMPYDDEFMRVYRQRHEQYEIHPDALHFYQGRRKLEDIWEWIEQLVFDKQDDLERTGTINSLRKELKEITDNRRG